MIRQVLTILLLIFFLHHSISVTGAKPDLTIAVVEYNAAQNSQLKPLERAIANVESYIKIIFSVNTPLDLIVFPENGITTGKFYNHDDSTLVTPGANPCLESDGLAAVFMLKLSCAARMFKTFIVVNLKEKFPCRPSHTAANCKQYGHYFYNTDVVFDRNGKIIARYRKYNLFGEFGLNRPTTNIEQTFTIDGVTFGIFTCFDILFKKPALDMVKKNITHFIFPTHWFSELPFLSELQAQEMWSHSYNVNLYSSGLNGLHAGSGGTGIFKGRDGTAIETILTQGNHTVLVDTGNQHYNTNKHPQEGINSLSIAMDEYQPIIDPSLKEFNSSVLDNKQNVSSQVCYDELCCNFQIKQQFNNSATNINKSHYIYHLVAYSGMRSFTGVFNGGVEVCGIIACVNASLASCGRKFPKYQEVAWPSTFEEITIKAVFELNDNKTQYPNSLLTSFRSINASQTMWASREFSNGGKRLLERTFSTRVHQNRLLTFAIYGRNFALDKNPNGNAQDDQLDQNNSDQLIVNHTIYLLTLVISSIAMGM